MQRSWYELKFTDAACGGDQYDWNWLKLILSFGKIFFLFKSVHPVFHIFNIQIQNVLNLLMLYYGSLQLMIQYITKGYGI